VKLCIEFWNNAYNLFSTLDEWKIFIKDIMKRIQEKNTTVESYRKDMKERT
jgi:hypothetical protein